MGVPALFRWLSQKYPKIISQVIEEKSQQVDGQEVPVDMTGKNPNGEEFDNLYLDMNGIVHPCSHPEDRPAPATEEEMMLAIFEYTNRVVNMVRPRKLLLIAVDGVAPRAKMNQQRSRRFRSAQEAKEKDEDKQEFLKMLHSQQGEDLSQEAVAHAQKKTWDSNAITPGTPFMDTLAASLKYWCAYKANTDPGWARMKVIISDASVPGEGEHKIMQFIRSQRRSQDHDPNTRHVIYGLDADLIMLGLATHEPHFRVLREDVFFQESKARTCRICGQKGHIAEACTGKAAPKQGEFDEKDKALGEKPFIWLHVSVLREYLREELHVLNQGFRFDLERAIDDWVFMCFFVGNDFLPHLPSLDIRENGIDTLIAIWRDNLPLMQGYVTEDGTVNLGRAQYVLDGLARQEDAIFRRRKNNDDRREANAKRRKLEQEDRRNSNFQRTPSFDAEALNSQAKADGPRRKQNNSNIAPPDLPLFVPGARDPTKEERAVTHEMVVNRGAAYKANQANKSAAAVLKDKLTKHTNGQSDGDVPPQNDIPESANGNGNGSVTQEAAEAGVKRKREAEDGDTTEAPGKETPLEPSAKDEEGPTDTVRLWEDGYSDRYYEQKFKVDPSDIAFRNQVAKDYVEGLAWVLLYYFQGCPSWTWYYPHHYAPFAADFVGLKDLEIHFNKGTPFHPFEQLMGVLPAASNHAIPEPFRPLMENEDSDIIDFYPTDFPIDLNGKKFAWQGVALLPFIDEQRLLTAMATKYPLLSDDDKRRNEFGKDILIVSDQNEFYDEVGKYFYSKKADGSKFELNPSKTQGLSGLAEKNEECIPRSTLICPLKEGMPDLEDDRSISVFYDMPTASSTHKSMLLRGVKLPERVLDRADIDATQQRANRSGRSHGGVPLRNESNGRRVNYADNQANPVAKYLDPNFQVPPHMANWGNYPPQNQNYNRQSHNSQYHQQGYNSGPPNGYNYPQNSGSYNQQYQQNSGYQAGGQHHYASGPPGRDQNRNWNQQYSRQDQHYRR